MKRRKEIKPILAIVFGSVLSVLLTITCIGIITTFALSERIGEGSIGYWCAAGQYISCLAGFLLTGKALNERIIQHISICFLAYFLTIVAASCVITDGGMSMRWGIMITTILAYASACAMCIRKKKIKRFKKRPAW